MNEHERSMTTLGVETLAAIEAAVASGSPERVEAVVNEARRCKLLYTEADRRAIHRRVHELLSVCIAAIAEGGPS